MAVQQQNAKRPFQALQKELRELMQLSQDSAPWTEAGFAGLPFTSSQKGGPFFWGGLEKTRKERPLGFPASLRSTQLAEDMQSCIVVRRSLQSRPLSAKCVQQNCHKPLNMSQLLSLPVPLDGFARRLCKFEMWAFTLGVVRTIPGACHTVVNKRRSFDLEERQLPGFRTFRSLQFL